MGQRLNLETALTLYGPLIMGWVVAFIIWRQYVALTTKWQDYSIKDTEAKMLQSQAMNEAIKALSSQ